MSELITCSKHNYTSINGIGCKDGWFWDGHKSELDADDLIARIRKELEQD